LVSEKTSSGGSRIFLIINTAVMLMIFGLYILLQEGAETRKALVADFMQVFLKDKSKDRIDPENSHLV
jgi:sulfite exporter TauE/SafE